MKKTLVILIAFLLAAVVQTAHAKNGFKEQFGSKKSGPIHVVSDRLEAYNEQKMAVFIGNVVATEGDKVIKSDQLYIFYKQDEDKAKAKKSPKANDEAGDLDRIEAKGNVRVTQGTKIITGEHAVYLNDDQKITVTGNPVMKDGANTVKGDKIIFLLDENRGIVESSGQSRVTAVFYPEDKNKKPQDKKKKVPEDAAKKVPEDKSKNVQDDKNKKGPEDTTKKVAEDKSKNVQEDTTNKVQDNRNK